MAIKATTATSAPITPSPISGPGAATGTACAEREMQDTMKVNDSMRKIVKVHLAKLGLD